METITKSPEETRRLGEKVADTLKVKDKQSLAFQAKRQEVKGARVFALSGDLGSGKTTFIQGFAAVLGVKQRIISPTFIIVRRYKFLPFTIYHSPFTYFYHIDLYRLELNVESEAKNLGIEDIWDDPKNIIAIEWAEKIKKLLPKNTIWIKFKNLGGDERKIEIK